MSIQNDLLNFVASAADRNNYGGFESLEDRNEYITSCDVVVPEGHVLIAEYSWHQHDDGGSAFLYIDLNGSLFIQTDEEDGLVPSNFQDWERLIVDYNSSSVWG